MKHIITMLLVALCITACKNAPKTDVTQMRINAELNNADMMQGLEQQLRQDFP